MRTVSPMMKALPLCCSLLFLAAAEDDCTIRIVTGEDEECEDVSEVCNLDCVLAVNDDGCEICECAQEPPPPEQCESDADCPAGLVCEFVEACPAIACDPNQPDNGACDVPCFAEGRCVEPGNDPCANVACPPDSICVAGEDGQAQCLPVDGTCFSDADCGDLAFCDFSTCGGTDPGNGGNAPDIACTGVCRPIDELSCANVLCDFGTHCIDTENGPACVPDESECNVDQDCGEGAHCEVTCQQDPSCPECDVCLIVGKCVSDDVCAQLCGPGQECRVNEDGSVECAPVNEPECTSDADCENGASCNAADVCLPGPGCNDDNACDAVCWGFCVEPPPAGCFTDEDCAEGEICVYGCSGPGEDPNDPDGGGNAPCFVEEGQCVPSQP